MVKRKTLWDKRTITMYEGDKDNIEEFYLSDVKEVLKVIHDDLIELHSKGNPMNVEERIKEIFIKRAGKELMHYE